MKYSLIAFGLILLMLGCNSKNNQTEKPVITSNNLSTGFILKGELKNGKATTVYLNKIIGNTMYQIDSANIVNNLFTLNGLVEYPERFTITFDVYPDNTLLIIENTAINLTIDIEQINNPIISGSPLNDQLAAYKNESKSIFRKIDYLYPRFQKARLENDVQKLEEIGLEMKKIELEFKEFSFKFIEDNRNSFIAPILLSDQLKSSAIDTLRIKQSFNLISDKVKNSPDAQIIASFLELH